MDVAWIKLVDWDAALRFAMVLARVSGVIWMLPAVGASHVPIRMRLGLAVVVSWFVLMMSTSLHELVATDLPAALAGIVHEAVIGLSLGIVPTLMVLSIRLAGQLASQMTGLSLFDSWDVDTGGPTSSLERLMSLSAITVFFVIGGHRQVLASLLESFHSLPPGQPLQAHSFVQWLGTILIESFAFGIRFAAPIAVTLIVSNLIVGLVSKTIPHFNALTVGTSFNVALTFVVILLSCGGLAWLIDSHTSESLQQWLHQLQMHS